MTTPLKKPTPTSNDPASILRSLRMILEPGQVTELRALEAVTASERRPHTFSGYFDDVDTLARAVTTIKSAKGIYFVPNPVRPELKLLSSLVVPVTEKLPLNRRDPLLL